VQQYFEDDEHLDDVDVDHEPYTRRRFLRESATALVLLLVGLPLVLLIGRGQSAPEPRGGDALPSASPQAPQLNRPVALVGGDALAPSTGAAAPVELALQSLSRDGVARFHPGSGFTVGSPSLPQLALQDLPGADLDLVVVQGGEVDVDAVPGNVEAQARRLVADLRAAVSNSTPLTLVGPIPPSGPPSPRLLRVRDELARAAKASRVHFVDPVLLGWVQGQQDLGDRLAAAIRPFMPGQ
jgi:hypothetical protein